MMQNKQKPFIKGYKFRIYPTEKEKQYFTSLFGSCRYVYNRSLSEAQAAYNNWIVDKINYLKPDVSSFGFINNLPKWKREEETCWLNNQPAQVLQHACKQAGDAYSAFFRRKIGYPRFKSKHDRQSATFSNQIYKLVDGKLKLAKCDSLITIRFDRSLPSDKLGACTISRTKTGKYYASFLCEYSPEKTTGTEFTGIDAGITDLATLSNGSILLNPKHYITAQHRLKILQRRLSRKQKGSKNRNKVRQKVALAHEHITNQRKDYIHKFTTLIIRENQAVGIESLQVKNMLKNRCLAKHIGDAAWGEMRRQLVYKAIASQHCLLVLADPYYPSTQLCSHCNQKPSIKIKLGVVKWICEHCHIEHARDLNAAKNLEILARSYYFQNRFIGTNVNVILTKPYVSVI